MTDKYPGDMLSLNSIMFKCLLLLSLFSSFLGSHVSENVYVLFMTLLGYKNLTSVSLIVLFLHSSYPTFDDASWVLGVGVVLQMCPLGLDSTSLYLRILCIYIYVLLKFMKNRPQIWKRVVIVIGEGYWRKKEKQM